MEDFIFVRYNYVFFQREKVWNQICGKKKCFSFFVISRIEFSRCRSAGRRSASFQVIYVRCCLLLRLVTAGPHTDLGNRGNMKLAKNTPRVLQTLVSTRFWNQYLVKAEFCSMFCVFFAMFIFPLFLGSVCVTGCSSLGLRSGVMHASI